MQIEQFLWKQAENVIAAFLSTLFLMMIAIPIILLAVEFILGTDLAFGEAAPNIIGRIVFGLLYLSMLADDMGVPNLKSWVKSKFKRQRSA